MWTQTDETWSKVIDAERTDTDDDVIVRDDGLHVHDRLFAYRQGDDVIADLSERRVSDLVARGMGSAVDGRTTPKGAWVMIADSDDWAELVSEAHEFVGEPHFGGQS